MINELKKHIIISEDEEEDAQFYLKTKGLFFHIRVIEYLKRDLNKIDWKTLSHYIRYDKKLRYELYKYICTLEEYLRAYISNKYEVNNERVDFIDKIKKEINKKSLIDILETLTFGEIINQFEKITNEDKKEIFPNEESAIDKLKSVRTLRNYISHQVFLLLKYKEKEHLIHDIKCLIDLLPIEYIKGNNGEGGITKSINKCLYNGEENLLINDKHIISI